MFDPFIKNDVATLNAYQIYMGLNLHFDPKTNYDYKKFGKLKRIKKPPNHPIFRKLSQKYTESNLEKFFSILFAYNAIDNFTDLGNLNECHVKYLQGLGNIESIDYIFESDVKVLTNRINSQEQLKEYFKLNNWIYGTNLVDTLGWGVRLETISILLAIFGIRERMLKDFLSCQWNIALYRCVKYSDFFSASLTEKACIVNEHWIKWLV